MCERKMTETEAWKEQNLKSRLSKISKRMENMARWKLGTNLVQGPRNPTNYFQKWGSAQRCPKTDFMRIWFENWVLGYLHDKKRKKKKKKLTSLWNLLKHPYTTQVGIHLPWISLYTIMYFIILFDIILGLSVHLLISALDREQRISRTDIFNSIICIKT